MLKRITLNGKRIPVPVPILSLNEALEWIQKHLMRPDHAITRIQLDARDIEIAADGKIPHILLGEGSDLRIKLDSPHEICLQTLDVLRNLSTVIGSNLKPIAVALWEHKSPKIIPEAASVLEDFQLMLELLDHILVLLDKRVDATNILSLQAGLKVASALLKVAVQTADWKAVARVLLNKIETPALDLATELTSVEKVIFELFADRTVDRKKATR